MKRPAQIAGLFVAPAALALAAAFAAGAEPALQRQGFDVRTIHQVSQIRSKILREGPSTKNIFERANFNTAIGRLRARDGRPELHLDSDRVFIVRDGAGGAIRLGGAIGDQYEVSPGELRGRDDSAYTGFTTRKLAGGTIVNVPRGIPYQLIASRGDLTFVVVRIR